MRSCTIVQLVTGGLAVLVFSFAGCGGSQAPPATPAETAETTAAPAEEAPAEPGEALEGDYGPELEAESPGADPSPSQGGDTETRTTEVIQKVVADNRTPIRECYKKARKDLPTLEGTMTIHFVLDPEGNVKKAELNQDRSDLKAPPVVKCAIEHLKTLKFPPSSRGMETTVNYPFNFKP